MENILSIEIDGEKFRYINNTWVDSMYCEAPGNILNQIYDNLIERADETSYETLLEYAKVMKNLYYGVGTAICLGKAIDNVFAGGGSRCMLNYVDE